MAGVKYDAHYSVASVDPPELVRFIKDVHPDVIFDYPRYKDGTVCTMWNLIPQKTMPPTRIVRYCCAYLKEQNGHGKGRLKVTGVRWAESVRRRRSHGEVTIMDKGKKLKDLAEQEYSHIAYKITPQGGIALPLDNRENAQMIEQCYRTRSTTVNPIVDWTDGEVWEFIKEYNIPYCCLYDQGFKRLGCIGCPMGSREQREMEFERWSKYKNLYMIAFQKMIENRRGELRKQRSDEELYEVWMQGNEPKKPDYSNQTAEDIMNGYLTERFKDFSGGGTTQERTTDLISGTDNARVAERRMERHSDRLYPYATTRTKKRIEDMTSPEEIIDWWID